VRNDLAQKWVKSTVFRFNTVELSQIRVLEKILSLLFHLILGIDPFRICGMGSTKSPNKDLRVLVIDVGGTNIKAIVTGAEKRIKIPSGDELSAAAMVAKVKAGVEEAGWEYDVISLGVPCVVRHERITRKPHNLAAGWIDFDFSEAFGCPVKLINDAAMQAYGSYEGGRMLFLEREMAQTFITYYQVTPSCL